MLCAIRKSDQQKINARDTLKKDAPFQCPKCGEDLNIKKGQIKIHHFAHKPPVSCQFGAGETEAHRKAKLAIYDQLSNSGEVSCCELEKDFKDVVPDIFAVIKNNCIAIEVQISNLTLNEIVRRTTAYNKLNINVLWLPLFKDTLNEKQYSPKIWEKWVHATYYGRIYYWVRDITVIPVHFSDYMLYKEESSWYDESGEECYGGGYKRRSKRYRTPNPYGEVNLLQHFSPSFREAWRGGQLTIPNCKIFNDTLNKWW